MRYLIMLSLLLSLILLACEKPPIAPSQEEIDSFLLSPQPGDTFRRGETIRIQANFSAEDWEMHGYELYVLDTSTYDLLFSAGLHTHDGLLAIDTSWVYTDSLPRAAELEIRCHIDHKGNYVQEFVPIILVP